MSDYGDAEEYRDPRIYDPAFGTPYKRKPLEMESMIDPMRMAQELAERNNMHLEQAGDELLLLPGEGTVLLEDEADVCDNCTFSCFSIMSMLSFLKGYDSARRRFT